jgi:hypothetical protein
MSVSTNIHAAIVLASLSMVGGVAPVFGLPLITNAVVTEGADAAELPPKFTGQTFDHPNEGAGFTVPSFGEDVPCFNDRNHEWNGAGEQLPIPTYLAGGEYLMFPNDDRDNSPYRVVVTLSEESDVYLLIDNRHPDGVNSTPPNIDSTMLWVTEDGWQPVKNGLNRNADPEVPDEVGVDEAGDGVGPGLGLNQWSSVYHRRVPAGTFTLGTPENPGRNMYGVVVTRVPGSVNNPPEITNVTPADNTLFHAAGSGLSFTARTVAPNSIPAANVKLVLNDAEVTTAFAVTGDNLSRTATFSGLTANTLYRARLIAVDQAGRGVTNDIVFDTFPSTALAVEAEDYDHSGGRFETSTTPGAYAGLSGVRDTDYHNNNRTAATANYRTGDFVAVATASDASRPAYAGGAATDYQVNALQAGDWFQYTRSYTAGAYQLYLRASTTASQAVRLDRVSGGVATPAGTFFLVPSRASFGYGALTDAAGRLVTVRLSGNETLRLTALAANVNLGFNYLLAIPAGAETSPGYVSSAAPVPGAVDVQTDAVIRVHLATGSSAAAPSGVTLSFDGADVTASATVTPTSAGVLVTYDPPGDLSLGRNYPVGVTFGNGTASPVSAAWSFSTVPNLGVIPANFGSAPGSGQTPGFQLKMRKAPDFNAAGTALTLANTTARADSQLADQLIDPDTTEPYINEAAGPSGDGRATSAVINFDQLAASAGYFPDDVGFPHVDLGVSPDPNNMAMEVTAYIEFTAGIHRLGVRSDDGFQVSTGPTFGEATQVLGAFVGGRGDGLPAGATEFDFKVETAGVYPIRLIWYEGNGGARVEFYSVNRESWVRTLVNDPAAGALKAFVGRSVVINVPTVAVTQPAQGARYPSSPTNVVLRADASVLGSQIAKVEFFAGALKVGESTSAPYQFTWNGVQAGRYTVSATATDVRGLSKESSKVSFQVGTPISVNFQASSAEVPEGYLADYGDVFDDRGNNYKYGWDVDNVANARDRNDARSPDERYDTFNHMQKPQPAGSLWEIEVPNGRYNVFAVAGEAANFDSVFNVQAEGVTVVAGTASDAVRFFEGQTAVNVTDGRLSVGNGPGASNNKICFIEIYPLPAETAPPRLAAPTLAGGNVTLTWSNGGTLESAPSPNGPWTSTGDSDGSYTEPASAAAKFFRVRR